MESRLNLFQVAPEGARAMLAVEAAIAKSGLESGLLHLVRLRASQINGCAYCIAMHVKEALQGGEDQKRLHLLAAWRETPLYSDRERAALNWTESLTLVAQTHAPDADFGLLQSQFNDEEIGYLTLLVGAINLWNRIQIGFRALPEIEAPR